MKTQKIIYTILLSFTLCFAHAQQKRIKSATKKYDKLAYIKTSEVLLEVVENGFESVDVLQKLGDSYYFNSKMEDAVKWYGKLVALESDIDPEYYYRYATALKTMGGYMASDKWMDKFKGLKPNELRSKLYGAKGDYISFIESISRYDIKPVNLSINTPFSDFGTAQIDNKIIFASAKGGGELHSWSEQPFLDLYSAEKQSDSVYNNITSLKGKINSIYHDSSVAITQNDSLLFFTRNNFFKNKYGKDREGVNRLKLFRAKKIAGKGWGEIQPVHFNSDDYSVAHPTISADGTKLYFASDMVGTLGLSDIFVVDINTDGSLGTPVNLGASINTEAQETFPFINKNGDLYFSSNGYPGLGGLDVYVVKGLEAHLKTKNTNKHLAVNIGRPVNSKADDFAFFENTDTKEVFFSSNRKGGKGNDDIYSFIKSRCEQEVSVIVKEDKVNNAIVQATLILYDEDGNELQKVASNIEGNYTFSLECNKEYLLRGAKEAYISSEKRFNTSSKPEDLQIALVLVKDIQTIKPCDDLANTLDIPVVYFDYDKYDITKSATVELEKVLVVLRQYPSMNLQIRSHTDCRGTYKYNMELSEKRAKATRNYLINKGVDANRIQASGFGESQLLDNCKCKTCTEMQHQKNRRSEFIIDSINGIKCTD